MQDPFENVLKTLWIASLASSIGLRNAPPFEVVQSTRMENSTVPHNERVLAAAVNVAAIFFPYAGPIVGYVVSSKMKFVRYHATRSLIEQIVATVIIGILLIASLLYSAYSIQHTMADGFDLRKIDWVTLLVKTVATWLLLGLWGIVNTVLNVRDALEALQGKVPIKPKWTEKRALRWSGLASK